VNDEEHRDQQASAAAGEAGQPSEEEIRARIDEQLRKVRVQDLLLESVVSVINLSARRIAKEDERDLEQAKVGIDAVRAIVGLLDEEPAKQVRDALSQVQMLYAQHAEGAAPGPAGGPEGPPAGAEAPSQERAQGAGSRLWTPPGTTPPR